MFDPEMAFRKILAVQASVWVMHALVGLSLVLFGLLILLVPRLLEILVAVCIMAAGAVFLVMAWRLRRLQKQCESLFEDEW